MGRDTGPADVRGMGMVHSALRRDLERSRIVLEALDRFTDARRVAVADHLVWLVDFLHHHHEGEDTLLFPEVRRRNPLAADLIDRMDADHRAVLPSLDVLKEVARRWRARGDVREEVVAALSALSSGLLPHLRREEEQMMPVVAATLTAREHDALDHRVNIRGKGPRQLGREGHFIIEAADDETRAFFLAKVPAPVAVLLLLGTGPSYRRASAARWGATPAEHVPSLTLAYLDSHPS